ncbi:hypothetical protein PG996_005300 [Apiospora saccharicola]|uniref:DUF1996 domain-containing protein n=1 Tax=Apiospora saccharicola TaxID=335842 RepID=A0ABR1VLC9_9PEZI
MRFQRAQVAAGLLSALPGAQALLRFSCSQLVVERLDPLVNPGVVGSPICTKSLNAFNATMDPSKLDIPGTATCTTCQFAEDFSNYWTAVLFFRARNGTYHRVPQKGNVFFEQANGGMTGFRMIVGDPMERTAAGAAKYRQLTYTCLQNSMTRTGETKNLPPKPCPAGIMANIRFPTYVFPRQEAPHPLYSVGHSPALLTNHPFHTPDAGTARTSTAPTTPATSPTPRAAPSRAGVPAPSTHPVKIPQLFYEVIWDTTKFNNQAADWPADGSQPFVWSYGDATGYGTHGDYVFGWKGDALQRAMDQNCQNSQCNGLKSQSLQQGNQCTVQTTVDERIDGWLDELPGGMAVTDASGKVIH